MKVLFPGIADGRTIAENEIKVSGCAQHGAELVTFVQIGSHTLVVAADKGVVLHTISILTTLGIEVELPRRYSFHGQRRSLRRPWRSRRHR